MNFDKGQLSRILQLGWTVLAISRQYMILWELASPCSRKKEEYT
jgi:hypothetical protein